MKSAVPGEAAGLAWVASHPLAYPALEVVHITGIGLLLGNLVLLELRVWGLAPELPLRPLARLSRAVTLAGFGLIVCSGLLMFASQPAELLSIRALFVKLGLVLLAGLSAAWFHARDSLMRGDGLGPPWLEQFRPRPPDLPGRQGLRPALVAGLTEVNVWRTHH